MLNTALRTSQQRVLGTAILQWDTFSLDVCHVLQFYREALAEPISHNNSFIILHHPWSSLYILESFGILTYFWKLLDTFGIYWRFVGDLSSGFHQLSSVIFSKYVQFWHFPIVLPPLCLPFLSPCCVSPVCLTVFGSKSSSQPFRLSKKEQTDGYNMKQFWNKILKQKWNRAFFTSLWNWRGWQWTLGAFELYKFGSA